MMTRRKAIKDFAYVAGLSLFLPRGYSQDVLPVRRRIVAAAGGGGGGADVAFDSTFEKALNSASPFSFVSNAGDVTGTVGSNSNRALFACALFHETLVTVGTVGVTWNGVSMSLINSAVNTGGNECIHWFGLINPATGNQTLSVTYTGAGPYDCIAGATSLYNVNQTTAWQNATQAGPTTSTAASITVNSTAGNMIVFGSTDNDASSATIANGTEDWQERDLSGNYMTGHRLAAGATTVGGWTLGSSVVWTMLGFEAIKA